MKWKEPWKLSIKKKEKYNPFSRSVIFSGLKLSAILLALVFIPAILNGNDLNQLLLRVWVSPVGGFSLAIVIYTIYWLSPIEVQSGPRGIVKAENGNLILTLWQHISAYKIIENAEYAQLVLTLHGNLSTIEFYIPKHVNLEAVALELSQNITQP
jgi:hypothetical protein